MRESVLARRALYLGGSALSMLFLCGMYWCYSIDFPYADQWDFVPLLEKAYAGHLTFGDFWSQHNEHRLVFPRLLMLGMALSSGWNIHWELAANFVLAVLTWMVLCAQARANGAEVHGGHNEPVYLLFSLLVFSLSQWGNWFLGWQLQEFMNVFAVVVASIALTWRRAAGFGVAVAVAFGFVATYSFANGILVWPIGLLLLLLQRQERGKAFRRHVTAWCVAGAVAAGAYLFHYQTPSYHASPGDALHAPVRWVLYVLAYLGQPVGDLEDLVSLGFELLGHGSPSGDHTFSILMGALGLLLWLVTLVQLRLSRVVLAPLLPWLGMALYAVGTAMMTGLGRLDDGVGQALSSRYVTMANLLWIPVVVQIYWVALVGAAPLSRRLLPVKVGILGLVLAGASLAGAYRWTEHYHVYSALRNEVLSGSDLERLRPLYPPAPEVIPERRVFLESHGLSIFGKASNALAPGVLNAPDAG